MTWTSSRKKQICWAALFYAAGGFLLMAAFIVVERISVPIWAWTSVAVTAAIMILSAVCLRVLYRREPFTGPGFWQLSIVDLMSVVLVCGCLLGLWNALRKEYFLLPGVPLCLALGASYLIGLLVATRLDIRQSFWKAIYACGFAGRWLGSLGVGAIIMLLVVGVFVAGPADTLHVIGEVLWKDKIGAFWVALTIRFLVLLFIIGVPLGAIARRMIPRSQPEIGDAPAKQDLSD